MKKAISMIAAVLVVTIFFTGCQATPEQPAVIGKDMEQMLEKAQDTQTSAEEQTLSEQYGIPHSCFHSILKVRFHWKRVSKNLCYYDPGCDHKYL